MRIRKQASKLFGWAYFSPFPSASSPPRSAAQYLFPAPMAVADPGELQCQINLSPWDAIEKPHRTNSQKELENTNDREEEEMMTGFFNHAFESGENEGVEAKVEEKKDEKMRAEENKRAVTKCKKTDGKGWHCKRDAQLPHTLCGYHLAQLRSYRARVEEKFTGDGERCHRRKQSAAAMEAGGAAAASNYYYYYSILGPWWGKRRAPADGKTDPGALADNDEDDEEDNDDDDDGSCSGGDDDGDVVHHKKKKLCKKKSGRKPVKARSLKSLL